MFCANCGATLSPDLSFCTNCGAKVGAPAAAAPSAAAAATSAQPAAPVAPVSTTPVQPAGPFAPPPVAAPVAYGPHADVKAIFSLILGILGIVPFSILAGIPAIILGHLAVRDINHSQGQRTGKGMATAGLVMGYLSIFLLIVFIALPNILRARMAPGESSQMGSLRTINTAEVAYSSTYPDRGFARDLATLGAGGKSENCSSPSPEHACLIDEILAGPTCTAGLWCSKSGYRFSVVAKCPEDVCTDYVATASPADRDYGHRNYCSTSDGVIRFTEGEPMSVPLSDPDQCRAWIPIQ